MTLPEYMDPTKFPLTTQPGLSAKQQMLIDVVNYDEVREAEELGEEFSPEEEARANELRVKVEAFRSDPHLREQFRIADHSGRAS
jgi:hypothetical protein